MKPWLKPAEPGSGSYDLIIRKGKGLKYREVPLVREAREPLEDYLAHPEDLAQR